jgi:hypothetical protein
MIKLVRHTKQLPLSLYIGGVHLDDQAPTIRGGFAEVHRATYGGIAVAIKKPFVITSDLEDIYKVSSTLALLWSMKSLIWSSETLSGSARLAATATPQHCSLHRFDETCFSV